MDRSALEFVHDLGASAVVPGDRALALPKSMELHSLERFQDARYRYRGALQTTSFGSFVAYCAAYQAAGAAAFIDPKNMKATAHFNLGTAEAPGHGDHTAALTLQRTAAHQALLQVNGQRTSQQAIAEWLEDWVANLTFANDQDQQLEAKRAIQAVRNLVIDATRKQEHRVEPLSQARSSMEQVDARARGDLALPSAIGFHCEPYESLASRTFGLRLSVITGGAGPEFVLRIQQLEQQQELMAQEFQQLLTGALETTGITTLIGTFALGS